MKYEKMPQIHDYVLQLKKTFPDRLSHVNDDKILYVGFSKNSSTVLAKIGKIPDKYNVFLDQYVYMMEIYKDNWDISDKAMKLYIILHELFHIPIDGFNSESKGYGKCVDHDLMDFKELVAKYGTNLENIDDLLNKVNEANK